MKNFLEILAVPARPFTANGTSTGIVTIGNTRGFYVTQIVHIHGTGLPGKTVQVKRVIDYNTLQVGPVDYNPDRYTSIDLYTTAAASYIQADFQNFSITNTNTPKIEQSVFEWFPIAAYRTILVDQIGNFFSNENPLPVSLSSGSVQLNVQLTHLDNFPNPGDIADSVRIGNGVNELNVNNDGSINVVVQDSLGQLSEMIDVYGEEIGVVSGASQVISTYTVPTDASKYFLARAEFSGSNIAEYTLYVNSTKVSVLRTHHGSGLSNCMNFDTALVDGKNLQPGDIIEIVGIHNRPSLGEFNARLQIVKKT